MIRKLILFTILLLSQIAVRAADWQWSISVKGDVSGETKAQPRAFLWIPPHCHQVRAVVVGMHNMIEEGIFEQVEFRRTMSELGFAIIWTSPILNGSQSWEGDDVQQTFENMMSDLATVSGYTELKYAPIVPLGHSAQATYPWNFAACNPGRTLAILSVHGDAPQTNLTGYGRKNMDWGDKSVDGIPGLMIEGEYEWWEARVQPALEYRKTHPASPVSFLCDAGHGHFDYSDEMIHYICLFLKKAASLRLPKEMTLHSPSALQPVVPSKGWLADRWRPDGVRRAKAAPYAKYKGNRDDAFWYFDKEMSDATELFYAASRGKRYQYIGYVQNGRLLAYDVHDHARTHARWQPDSDGLTFHLSAAYTDSTHSEKVADHSSAPIKLSRICGPVIKQDDTTFSVRFYRMGMDNPRRTSSIWLLASSAGDDKYKSSVHQLSLDFPLRNKEGKEQNITFPQINDTKKGTKSISLNATSDSGMPVYYYIQDGPAEVDGNKIIITDISERAKMPIKVTVVAWQYGRNTEPKIQSAEPVYRTFYIVDKFDESLIDNTIQSWMDAGYYPGGAICIMKGDRTLLHKTYGNYTDNTQAYVASAGKWVAAATIATVVDKGKLQWTDKVSKWLKEFKDDPKGDITLLQLLSHTSGIRPYQPYPATDNYNSLDSSVRKILPLDTVFTAGNRFQYGGLAMQIAGRMAEKAEKKDFENIFETNIARPLGMTGSHFVPIDTTGGHSPMLAGGLCTTLHDYMAFLKMIFNDGIYDGKQIISASSVAEMQKDQIKNTKVMPDEYVQKGLGNTHNGIYGLGEWRELIDQNGEAYQISSPGWAGAYPWINKHDGIYGFFISHVIGSSAKEGGFSSFYGSPILSKETSEINMHLNNK